MKSECCVVQVEVCLGKCCVVCCRKEECGLGELFKYCLPRTLRHLPSQMFLLFSYSLQRYSQIGSSSALVGYTQSHEERAN